ncbi:hypothetical protein LCGC14_1876620 [marine sediment metagenome]|uniref:Uncharacterized protein n=1 Tax=marine sediment metagenome TaxID=412755 RepID=A0A0F9IHJ5_9ZZZZ
MKKIVWIAIGGGVLTSLLLLTRRVSAATVSSAPPPPKPAYGETKRVVLFVPNEWRRLTNTEAAALPELITEANAIRSYPGFTSLPYGTIFPFVASDGKTYATWVEQHYHAPGGSIKPWGYHHGVTLLALKSVA